MPPSPALRCSPRREHKMENTHNRGCSFERELALRIKDDDLALFNDMQNRETENFLLHPDKDFDDSLSNLRYLSDFKLGISIPPQGERSDLFDADEDKNDYDWLLTPPDTPLFPSLDDEEPQTHNQPPRGRSQSQPINISNSFSIRETTHGRSRSSASPRRLSPSSRSSNNFGQFISRPSSAPRSSPPPIVRPASPSQRLSTPNKLSTPTPRSSTPMLRRSTGSSGYASSSVRRGTSPMRTSRGNSASPKLQGWQSKLPSFSSDAPPNRRTSLSDRPSPLEIGLSPIPRSGRGRHSLSPAASRSASSSHSNDQDLFSSYSRGSIVSSSDDVDSLQSVAISSSLPARRNGMSGSSRPMSFSKKLSRTSPSNSMPKRSFDSVLRQMDHRKTPQTMFRPLLSSVPTTSFYVGKANTTHRPMFSRNSLLATSMSASSNQGANVVPDMASSEHDQNDITEWDKIPDPENHKEVLILDQADDIIIEDGGKKLNSDMPNNVDACGFEGSMVNFSGVACVGTDAECTYATSSVTVVDDREIMSICSKCGKWFSLLEVVVKTDFCQDCAELDELFATGDPLLSATVTQNRTASEVQLSIAVPELPETSSSVVIQGQRGNNIEEGLDCVDSSYLVQSVMDQSESLHSDMKLDIQQDGNLTESDIGNQSDPKKSTAHFGVRIDKSEGPGISVLLLPQPDSSKWPVQSRAFSATNIPFAEPSYVRDNTGIIRRSFGRDNASSSSVDLGSSRQIDVQIQHQISCSKIEMDSVRSDMDAKSESCCSYFNLTINAYEPSVPPKSDTDRNFNRSEKGVENETLRESVLITGELDSSLDRTDLSAANTLSCREDFVGGDAHVNANSFVALNTPNSPLFRYMERHHYSASAEDNLKDEDCPSCIIANGDPREENERSFLDIGVPNSTPNSSIIAEQSVLNDLACQRGISDAATNSSSVIVESQVDHGNFQDLPTECGPAQIPSDEEAFHEQSASTKSELDLPLSSLETGLDDHVHGIRADESTVIVEGPTGHMPKSLTLAEATDTILFCSSIIHDITYKAATIGMERELMSNPTVMLLGKSVNDQNDSIKMMPNKHTPKSQKLKRRKLETKQTKSPETESGNNFIVQEFTPLKNDENIPSKALDSARPPKLESKCNCAIM